MRRIEVVCALATAALILATQGPSWGAGEALRPIKVIAHRGASGYLPEHTLEAYALAYGVGADYIEPDLVMTRDRVLISRHDLHLELTTDVREVFPQRARPDGHWYVADFDLAEIKRLQARSARSGRFARDGSGFSVATLEEVLQLVSELNRLTGCLVGVYPEIKDPAFHAAEGLPIEARLLEILAARGYRHRGDPIRIQSFDPASLRRLRFELGSELTLVQLVSARREQAELRTEAGLDQIASYADGIAPAKAAADPELVRAAHRRGLFVDVYSFAADDVSAPFASFAEEVRAFVRERRVDGLFADHPDAAIAALGAERPPRTCIR